MTKLLSIIIAATFAAASVSVMAQDKKADAKKPTAEAVQEGPEDEGLRADEEVIFFSRNVTRQGSPLPFLFLPP